MMAFLACLEGLGIGVVMGILISAIVAVFLLLAFLKYKICEFLTALSASVIIMLIIIITDSMRMQKSRSKGVKGVETEATAPMTLPPNSPELEMQDANIAYGETEVNIAYGVVDEGTTETDMNVYEAMDTP